MVLLALVQTVDEELRMNEANRSPNMSLHATSITIHYLYWSVKKAVARGWCTHNHHAELFDLANKSASKSISHAIYALY